MTSATDALRALLDERGVRHYDTPNGTCWGYLEMPLHGRMYTHYAVEVDDLLCVDSHCITPEQAVAATLGPGTCHPVISDNLNESEGTGDAWANCSNCGHLLFVLTDPNSEPPNYCPSCGRKVVG